MSMMSENFAHRQGEQLETLEEHTEKTYAYFKKICDKKNVDKAYDRFLKRYLENMEWKEIPLLNKIFYEVPRFHDYGKLNPVFQNEKMNQKIKVTEEQQEDLGSRHSLISAILYLDSFLPEIRKTVKCDESCYEKIRHLIFVNAFVISRHHSDLNEFIDFLNSFEDNEARDILEVLDGNIFGLKKMKMSLDEFLDAAERERRWVETGRIGKKESMYVYTYERLLYSLLVAADYYATSEFMSGVQIRNFGEFANIDDFYQGYKKGELYQKISEAKENLQGEGINGLRNKLFWETEEVMRQHLQEPVFYLEAPTGSGKSNVAMNLSFLLAENNNLQKIFYVYPFNTLVEQNMSTLEGVFGENEEFLRQIAVINSITPFKLHSVEKEDNQYLYEKALLNRQFLNDAFILTTSVSLFHLMFSEKQNQILGFHQMMNSVIVIDEVQNLNNLIWTEIVEFFHVFCDLLNIRVVFMSATLPAISELAKGAPEPVYLVKNRMDYFNNPLFRDRVKLDFSLLEIEKEEILRYLFEDIIQKSQHEKKILVEFIKKETAKQFFKELLEVQEEGKIRIPVYLLTGEDNIYERKCVLEKIKKKDMACILIATQVVEAGVDIDMDIGYKDISLLDSEEQFLGRINRSAKRNGIVKFFDFDEPQKIYKNDYRTNEDIRLPAQEMKEILLSKDFGKYYSRIIEEIRKNNQALTRENVERFYKTTVAALHHKEIAKRMELISQKASGTQVFFNREIDKGDGTKLIGAEVWKRYKDLLMNMEMNYSKKQYHLSVVRAEMNHFIYQINIKTDFIPDDEIGELIYVENGDDYFSYDKLDTEKFNSTAGLFV